MKDHPSNLTKDLHDKSKYLWWKTTTTMAQQLSIKFPPFCPPLIGRFNCIMTTRQLFIHKPVSLLSSACHCVHKYLATLQRHLAPYLFTLWLYASQKLIYCITSHSLSHSNRVVQRRPYIVQRSSYLSLCTQSGPKIYFCLAVCTCAWSLINNLGKINLHLFTQWTRLVLFYPSLRSETTPH